MDLYPKFAPFSHAVIFLNAAKKLDESGDDFYEVSVMNYAFSVELLLKCFLIQKAEHPQVSEDLLTDYLDKFPIVVKTHKLDDLFENLLPEVQTNLSKFFEEEVGENLKTLIKDCSEYFLWARYNFHVGGVLDRGKVKRLAIGLHNAFNRYRSEIGQD